MRMAHVKNWAEFQHYKDRSPPWIKLHRALLDDFDFQCLPVASRALAPMLWLLAAEHSEGLVCVEPERIAFRLRLTVKEAEQAVTPLIEKGFFIIASNVLADCKQCAIPETETETETEEALSVSAAPKPDGIPAEEILAAYRELLPDFPQPRKLDADRKKKIIARWREDPERQSLGWWREFWGYVAKSDFLTGRSGKWSACNIDWLLQPANMRKVTEGNYENRSEA